MPFDFLCERLRSILAERGMTEPTEPQREASPIIQTGANVLLVAPTGIGKTEAAMLPIFDALYRVRKKPGIRCLYVTPLRALNRDMMACQLLKDSFSCSQSSFHFLFSFRPHSGPHFV